MVKNDFGRSKQAGQLDGTVAVKVIETCRLST